MATHDLEAARNTDRVISMLDGRIDTRRPVGFRTVIETALSRFRVFGLRDLRTHWVRSLVSAAVVAVAAGALFLFGVVALCVCGTDLIVDAVGVSVGVSGALANLTSAATDSLSSLGRTDIYVSLTPSSVVPAGSTLDPAVVQRVRDTPGVQDVAEGQWAYATLGEKFVSIQAVGEGRNAVTLSVLDQDVRAAVLRGDGVASSRTLGEAQGISVGSTIELPTPTGIREVEVLALVDYLNATGGTMAISLHSMQQWFDRPGATYLEIAVLERRRELGVLRAMGGRRGTLARMVIAEALAVGIVGGILGIGIGAAPQYLSTLILGASKGIFIPTPSGRRW